MLIFRLGVEPFDVCALEEIEICSHNSDVQPSDGCRLWPPCTVRDGFDELVEMVIVDCFEVATVRGLEYWIGDCGADDLSDTRRDSLFCSDRR